MKTSILLVFACLLAVPALATPPPEPTVRLDAPCGTPDGAWGRPASVRADTVWFGGDDGTGTAFEDGVWDWDTIVSDPFQGWTARDLTEDPDTYFYRVTADSFAVHGDPCTPLLGPGAEIWCGVHEDQARMRDFVAGMGYGNWQCQQARSPLLSVPAGSSVVLAFRYFNDCEQGFDYTHVTLNCFLADGTANGEVEVAAFDGIHGSYDAPAIWNSTTPYADLPAGTAQVQLEFRFRADGAWSDEDGNWATDCGPFAADDVGITIGGTPHGFDFEDGPQGWTFQRCPGIGSFMRVWDEATWTEWVHEAGLECCPSLSGNALGFCKADSSGGPPYFPFWHDELASSGVVERGSYLPPEYNSVYVRMGGFAYLTQESATMVRGGWSYYPYVTDVNPVPHWSPRGGQDGWAYTGGQPFCTFGNSIFDWDLSHPPDGQALPDHWEKMRFVFETATDIVHFRLPPSGDRDVGETLGSPLLDRVQVGLTHRGDGPTITPETGMTLMDGFGQHFPEYLEPGDVGNANVEYNLALEDDSRNDWNADTATISGPSVGSPASRWLARLCLRVARTGPRQEMIPGYIAWKQRLAYAGDPEQEFVCVQMDSAQISLGGYRNKFVTYFHESDPGFDHGQPDYTPAQEILPDEIFVPGTQIRYYYESWWYNGGAPPADFYRAGPEGGWEFEILPSMRPVSGEPYAVEWPSVLYVDAVNRGSEYYIRPTLEALGLEYDTFDYGGTCSCWNAPMKRSFGGGYYNPGGWGNNGCTLPQLLGYRLIVLDTGTVSTGGLQNADFELFRDWLASTDCALYGVRRGFVFSGDEVAHIMDDTFPGPAGHDLLVNTLGATYAGVYRELNQDDARCVYLEPAAGAVFTPSAPGVGVYGNECGSEARFSVLGLAPGIPNVTGNLRYYSYQGTGSQPYVDFAQVVRQNVEPGVANWKTILEGFGWFHLSERHCLGEDCSADSACVVSGLRDLAGPELAWIQAGGAPFVHWRYPCEDVAVGDEAETHPGGPVTWLQAPRPNPFRGTASIRFTLAAATRATVEIFDVGGRRVRVLLDGERAAGENTVVWDGADDAGRAVSHGLFWVQLRTGDGYVSTRRLLQLR